MTRPRLLITGGTGLLGVNWAAAVRDEWDVMLCQHTRLVNLRGAAGVAVDLTSIDHIRSTLRSVKPHCVVHAAGLTSVEACEAHPQAALLGNCELAENVALVCFSEQIAFVHISTDHLFNGRKPLATEEEPIAPLNLYGHSKAKGEARVLAANPAAIVARTNFFGWGPPYRQSFSDRIIHPLRAGQQVFLFEDVYFTPILAESLAHVVHRLVSMRATGVFNVVGRDRLTKYEFGMRLAQQFRLDTSLIRPSRLSEMTGLVKRPLDMSLSIEKVSAAMGRGLASLDVDIARLQQQESSGIAKEFALL
jgi:dTDP-4-dehydrorhamnose reductase